jgi:hypothetical protein
VAQTKLERSNYREAWFRESNDMHSRQETEFGPLRTRAINLITAMRERLPPDKAVVLSDRLAENILSVGMLAGPGPAKDVADLLERLARALPQ